MKFTRGYRFILIMDFWMQNQIVEKWNEKIWSIPRILSYTLNNLLLHSEKIYCPSNVKLTNK